METKEIIGRNPVLEYLRSLEGNEGAELFIARNAHGKIIDTIASLARGKNIHITYCEKSVLARVDSSSRHQGVMLRLRSAGIKAEPADLLSRAAADRGVIVLLDQLTDPHNVGSIIRSAEALGATGVALAESHAAGLTPTVVKSSAGATAYMDILSVSNVAQFLDRARDAGFWTIGASTAGESALERLRELRPAVVVIGAEGSGMRRLTAEKCDMLVRIPLRGNIESLNASVAAGIILYEILKD